MTAARQKRKRYFCSIAAFAGLLAYAGLAFVLAAGPGTSRASAGERIVVDWHTGLAINGYDPVAFFTDGKPMLGSPDLEQRKGDVVWRFTNVGNRAAFVACPMCICRNMASTTRSVCHAALRWREIRMCGRSAASAYSYFTTPRAGKNSPSIQTA
ncbi:MAG TPA: hypothetical protein VE396_07725 [Xanthobacteraceae bacterium]|nr:hypothetical protein [Xanthobacteraceae bacterium]